MNYLVKRPVAFRVQRANNNGVGLSTTEWRLFEDEKAAYDAAEQTGAVMQALFVRDGTAIVAEWEPIETAPQDDNAFFLVCGVGDDRSPFVVRGSILKNARQGNTPSHLHLHWLTHWMPLPALPTALSRPSNYEDRHPQDRNEERMMPLSDINDLDEVVHELGIQDSHVTPAEAVRELNREIEELRAQVARCPS